MKDRPSVYIEGDPNLRKGFRLLIQTYVKKKFKIVMGESKSKTIKKFQKDKHSKTKFLLVDLDKDEGKKKQEINVLGLNGSRTRTFFMIQKMEGWFLSQPKILDTLFNVNTFSKFKRPAKNYQHPDRILERELKKQKKEYNKSSDPVEILASLDQLKLKRDFKDFEDLLKLMKKEL